MAQTFDEIWMRKTGRPLRIVAAEGWLGGLVAMRSASRPSVFTDGDDQKAPWITKERLGHGGALVLWRADRPVPPGLLKLTGMTPTGTARFSWSDVPRAMPLAIGWGIVQPHTAESSKGAP